MATQFKILVVGEGAVGKTSIATRYTTGGFKESHLMTVGANFMLKNLEMEDGTMVRLSIWDTAGQEKFRRVVETYYKGGKGVLICFDITNRKTFEELEYWRSTSTKHIPDASFILVGNKADLEEQRAVSKEDAEALAKEWNLPYFETSAKMNYGIDECFLKLTHMMLGE